MRARRFLFFGLLAWPAPLPASPGTDADALIQQLSDEYVEAYRQQAQKDLVSMGRSALPALLEALSGTDPARVARVIEVLGDVKDRRAVAPLMDIVSREKSGNIRCKSLESLGKLGDPSLFGLFVREMKSPDLQTRSFAIWGLGELRTRQAVPHLMDVLRKDQGYPVMVAIDALGKSGGPHEAAALLEYLKFEDVQTRYVAALALGEIGDRGPAPAMTEAMLREEDSEVQEALAKSLGKIGGEKTIARLMEMLKDAPSPETQRLAEIGLAAAGIEAIFPLLELLQGNNLALKLSAARILGSLRSVGAQGELLEMLKSSDPLVRSVAIKALGECGDAAALSPLKEITRKSYGSEGNEAEESLRKIFRRRPDLARKEGK